MRDWIRSHSTFSGAIPIEGWVAGTLCSASQSTGAIPASKGGGEAGATPSQADSAAPRPSARLLERAEQRRGYLAELGELLVVEDVDDQVSNIARMTS